MIDDLYIEGNRYPAQLVIFDVIKFDVTVGMNWLMYYGAQIECVEMKL